MGTAAAAAAAAGIGGYTTLTAGRLAALPTLQTAAAASPGYVANHLFFLLRLTVLDLRVDCTVNPSSQNLAVFTLFKALNGKK